MALKQPDAKKKDKAECVYAGCHFPRDVCIGACKSSEEPCQTCNDDPEVCATVPGLRHCEAANRPSEKLQPTPRTDANVIRGFDAIRITKDEEQWVRASIARQLERELAAAQADAAQARKAANSWKDELTALQSASADIRHRHEIIVDNVRLRKALIDIQAAYGSSSSYQQVQDSAFNMAKIAEAALDGSSK